MNNDLKEDLQIIGFWVILIALSILFVKSYEYRKRAMEKCNETFCR